jgi:ribosomal-protein-alanine N-acetyltransferase
VDRITGENIYLRNLRFSDYEQYYEVKTRCYDWLNIWEPTFNGKFQDHISTPALFAARVEAFERGAELDNYYGFAIFLHDSTFIGEVTIGNIERGPFQSAKLGYWIDKKYAGRGLMPQAVQLVVDFAFEELEFKRIEVAIVPRNKASIRVVEKLGFDFEGISKEYIEVNGVREDHNRYVKLAD